MAERPRVVSVANHANAPARQAIPLIEYVLVHELAHLTVAFHGPEFWRLVERWLPDFEDRRRLLRELGPRLEW